MSEKKRKKKRKNPPAYLTAGKTTKFGKSDPNPLAHKGKGLVKVRNPLGRNGSGYKISKKS